jgi:hypothetical protein
MEIIIIISIIVCPIAFIAWILWRKRTITLASDKAALDKAWHVVRDDPNYMQRRLYEERRSEDEARARKEAKDL